MVTHRVRFAVSFARRSFLVVAATVAWTAPSAFAQDVPWDVFVDSESSSVCDLVNASNTEFVVLSSTGELVLVTGDDVILGDSFVDADGNVFFNGEAAGFISFADDGDGFRTLWWVDFFGSAVALDTLSLTPFSSNDTPQDFIDVECDACAFWDDPADCPVVVTIDPAPALSFNFCGLGMLPVMLVSVLGVCAMRRRRS